MATSTMGKKLGDVVKFEVDAGHFGYCREKVTILAGSGAARALTVGMVVAKVTKGTASATAFAGNTGTGAMGSITVGAAAKPGRYTLLIRDANTNAGNFIVTDPDGIAVGEGTVAVAFDAGGLAFTLADATDFIVGDGFYIDVAAGSGKWVQYLDTGTTGIEDALGVLLYDVTAADGTDNPNGIVLARGPAVVSDAGLVWPATADAGEKATAIAQLEALGIKVATGV